MTSKLTIGMLMYYKNRLVRLFFSIDPKYLS